MAKNDKSKVNQASIQERNTVNQQYGDLINTANKNLNEQTAAANDQNSFVTGAYKDIINNGGVDPTVAANLRALNRKNSSVYDPVTGTVSSSSGGGEESGGGSGGGIGAPPSDPFSTSRGAFSNFINTGGVDIGAMKEALPGYRKIADTGGYDPTELTNLRGDVGTLRKYGMTGGLTEDEIKNAVDPGYQEYATTGGYSDKRINDSRNAVLQTVRARAAQDQQQLENARRVGGGDNFAAAMARTARQNTLAGSDAALKGEIELQGAIDQGRQFGIKGRADTNQNLRALLANNRIAATGAAADRGTTLEQNLTGNKLNALGGITNTQQGAEEIAQRGKIAGAQGMFGVEQADLSAQLAREAAASAASEAAAGRASADAQARADDERWWAQFGAGNEQYLGTTGLEGKLNAASGLTGLYGTAPGAQGQNYSALLNAMNGRAGGAQNALGLQLQSAGPSGWDRAMQVAGMVAPVASAFINPASSAGKVSQAGSRLIGSQPLLTSRPVTGWNG